MLKKMTISLLCLGFLANEAKAAEAGVGLGRLSACVLTENGGAYCAAGPSLTGRWGFNLWGKNYDISAHEKPVSSVESSGGSGSTVGESFANNYHQTNFVSSLNFDSVEDVLIAVAVSLVFVSIGYAIVYPFSSRADMGVIGRVSYQSQTDMSLSREDLGLYFRAYLSQHFPIYLYGSGVFSNQTLAHPYLDDQYTAFVKSVGLGIMSPDKAGLYFQGVWERSQLLNPSIKEVIEDSSTNRTRNQSMKKILDASHFELGYLWYY